MREWTGGGSESVRRAVSRTVTTYRDGAEEGRSSHGGRRLRVRQREVGPRRTNVQSEGGGEQQQQRWWWRLWWWQQREGRLWVAEMYANALKT